LGPEYRWGHIPAMTGISVAGKEYVPVDGHGRS
jgi:hypothetical protein